MIGVVPPEVLLYLPYISATSPLHLRYISRDDLVDAPLARLVLSDEALVGAEHDTVLHLEG